MRPTFWIAYRNPWIPVNIQWWAPEDFLRLYPPHKRVDYLPTSKWTLDWGRDARGHWIRVLGLEVDQGY